MPTTVEGFCGAARVGLMRNTASVNRNVSSDTSQKTDIVEMTLPCTVPTINETTGERRYSGRAPTRQICSIIFENGEEEKCMLTNISVGGAEITRYFIDELPKEFLFQIEKNLLLPAKAAWSNGNTHGIQFKIGGCK